MKAIILAGGKGTRLPESAKDIPKALVKINKELSIVDHQLSLLKRHGIEDVIFALGFRNEQLIDHINGKYEYVVEDTPLGTGGAIKYASKGLTEPFLVLNGDILSDLDFTSFMSHFNEKSPILGALSVFWMENASDYGLITHKEGIIGSFYEKPKKPVSGHINTGFYILNPEVFKDKKEDSFSVEKDIFPELARKKLLSAYIHEGKWTDAGTEDRLKAARETDWLK